MVAKRALLIAYHYPPIKGSSGVLRTLKFSRYLSELGWQPIILTIHPHAYNRTAEDQLPDIPNNAIVHRAFGFNSVKKLSIAGRYPSFFAWPDNWNSWAIGGTIAGLKLIRKYKPQVIWSTYPIPTAHIIGMSLTKLSKLPWVADFRDSMTEDDYPPDPKLRAIYRWIERKTVNSASDVTFTAPSTVNMYANRYPDIDQSRWKLIYNGYDEADFSWLDTHSKPATPNQRKLFVHAGILYPNERNPIPFFDAIASLKQSGDIDAEKLLVRLRATVHDDLYQPMLEERNIADIVELAPPIPYQEALKEMADSDGLLLFQASNCNHQIPAKLYEYLRVNKPILALTDRTGDTAKIMLDAGIDNIADLNNVEEIAILLKRAISNDSSNSCNIADASVYKQFSREYQTRMLADIFDKYI